MTWRSTVFFRRLTTTVAVLALSIAGFAGVPLAAQANPNAPTGLDSISLGSGSVKLFWDPTPGASAYHVEVATESTFGSTSIVAKYNTSALDWIPETALSDLDGRDLFWHVAAFGTGTTESTLGAYSDDKPLALARLDFPTLLSPGVAAPGLPTQPLEYPDATVFSWATVPGAVSYKLEYSGGALGGSDGVTVPGITGNSYTPVTPLARKDSNGALITWKWRVQANFFNGTTSEAPLFVSDWSPAFQFQIVWTDEVNEATLFPADGLANRYSDIKFSWDAVPGAAKYRLDFGREKTIDGTGVQDPTRNDVIGTTYVPTTALIDTSYYWQVTPLDINGVAGVASDVFEFTKKWAGQDEPAVASATTDTYPKPLTGSTNSASPTVMSLADFELKWQPMARATLYEVEAYAIGTSGVVTCRTASTSATVIALQTAGAQVPGKLVGSSTCLWNSNPATGRIEIGGTYRWRVRAINYSGSSTTSIQSANPVGTVVSEWSDPQAGDTSRYRYVQVAPNPVGAAYPVTLNTTAFNSEITDGGPGQPAPLLVWNAYQPPANDPNTTDDDNYIYGYEVRIFDNADRTSEVARARTDSARLRLNGVLDDNSTSQAYYASVRIVRSTVSAGIDATGSQVSYIGDETAAMFQWTKSSKEVSISAPGITPVSTRADGTVVLAWQPHSVSGKRDGGSRGYLIEITKGSTSLGTAKVEYPFYVAQNPATGKPLGEGDYKFVVSPLDANNKPGKVSEAQSFTIAVPVANTPTSSVSGSTTTLRWKTDSPAAEYALFYKLSSTGAFTQVSDLKHTAAVLRDLRDGTYDWQVQSFDATASGNPSGLSELKHFTVGSAIVTLNTPSGAVLPANDRVLSWQSVPGASRYLVLVSENSNLSNPTIFETSATSFALPDQRPAAKAFYWRVRAVPEKTYALTSSTRPILAESVGAPSFTLYTSPIAPTLGTLTLSGATITANWALLTGANSGASDDVRYMVQYRVKTTSEEWPEPYTTVASATSFTTPDLPSKTSYQFRVAALNSQDLQGPWSAVKELSTGSQPLSAPANAKATGTLGGLAVSWSAVPAASQGGMPLSGYTVRYKAGGGGWVGTTVSGTSITLAGLAGQTSYDVEIAALNAIGEGPAAVVSAKTLDLPLAPGTVTAQPGDASITVSWSVPASDGGSPITGYVLEQTAFDAKTKVWSAWASTTVGATATSVAKSGLVNGNTYRYRLVTKTKLGSSTYSNVAEASPAGKPLAPLKPKVTTKKGTFILKWSTAPNNGAAIKSYVVQYSSNGKKWKTIKTVKASVKKYTVKTGKKGKLGYFRVVAKNAIGTGTYSSVVSVVRK